MEFYQGHPARERTWQTPSAANFPVGIQHWCHKIPREEQGIYPIDQSSGGEDDDPDEHEAWVEELKRLGRNPKAPWKSQFDGLSIDSQKDYIADQGEQVWNILEAKKIKHVILTGVHTNMCVLGRPFGLRRMVEAGKSTVLMSDMTDTMYDPRCRPFVSHFTGTDLIIDHIERHVCPTITSDQLLGGRPFRFSADSRPTIAILMAEDEYKTEITLPPWSISHLGKQYRLRWIFGSETERHDIPGIDAVREADLLIVSVRRRPLPAKQLAAIRQFAQAGKPMLGIRTASHAFSVRQNTPSATATELDQWPEFDRQVWGGNYQGHHGNQWQPAVNVTNDKHPIFAEWGTEMNFVTPGSLYKVSPLAMKAVPLATGKIEGQPAEPVAWTYIRDDGGKSFYTSLGHFEDFDPKDSRVSKMLASAVAWLLSPISNE
jgi:type 1 glutamine amidotransferase/nicotinamidase-related amidase